MRKRELSIDLSGYDWISIGLTFGLMLIGWLMIFASEYSVESFEGLFDLDKSYGKQLLWIFAGLGLGFGAQFIDGKFYQTFAFVIYTVVLLLLIAVLFTKPINGATSWFEIGGFRFQPSEFAKTSTNIALAALLSMPDVRMQSNQGRLQALGIISIPMILIVLQGDAGSTLVYAAFLLVLFRAGLSIWFFIIGLLIAFLFIGSLIVSNLSVLYLILVFICNIILLRYWRKDERLTALYLLIILLSWVFTPSYLVDYVLALHGVIMLMLLGLNLVKRQWQLSGVLAGGLFLSIIFSSSVNYIVNNILKEHQQERIWVWLRPEKCDPLGPLYNLEQSKYAIGSGGWFGKGFLEGERTKLDYVPEQSTDFIFCTVGEEWGFFGSSFVILLFTALLLRIVHIAERQRTHFAKYYAYGVASIIFFHLFVNVGMTMGLLPVIGIPLPFISYGGSSLFSFSIMIALLIKLDHERNLSR